MQAMVATQPAIVDDNCRFPDSGATNHDQTTKRILFEGVVDGRLYNFNLIKQSIPDNTTNQCRQSLFSLSSSFAN